MRKFTKHFHCIMIIGSAIFSIISWIGIVYLLPEPRTPLGSLIVGAYFTSVGWFGASVVAGANELTSAKRHRKLLTRVRAILKSQNQAKKTSKNIDTRLKAIESQLESSVNESESAQNCQCDEPAHSNDLEC